MGVVQHIEGNDLTLSFYNIDNLFDFILDIGMKPFVELSFMPALLASGSETVFHYKGNITPPKDDQLWEQLVSRLAQHCIERYGLEEVRSWFFEVWNEPNLHYFWSGTQEDYFRLYQSSAKALKSVDSHLKIGGPSTASNAWLPELKSFCHTNDVPLDFLSTHHYPTDVALGFGDDQTHLMHKSGRGVLKGMVEQARKEAGDLPLYYTEWNCSSSVRNYWQDDPYLAAFLVKTMGDHDSLVEGYSFWVFSDIFEELNIPRQPFHGGFGLLNWHGIPKPAYHAFRLLGQLGHQRLNVSLPTNTTIDIIATKEHQTLSILLSNHQVPLSSIKTETVELSIQTDENLVSAGQIIVDENHGYPKKAWESMGRPNYLTPQQVNILQVHSQITEEPLTCKKIAQGYKVICKLKAHAICFLKLTFR